MKMLAMAARISKVWVAETNYRLFSHKHMNIGQISVQLGVLMGTFAVSVQGWPLISILSR